MDSESKFEPSVAIRHDRITYSSVRDKAITLLSSTKPFWIKNTREVLRDGE